MTNKFNHLIHETSPYLLQHAQNPVDWYPWGEAALEKARQENKPILLSIGYAACHWCHVMAHESFADEQTADLMNRLFVNIKVDREERPDLDKIYQTAHALLTQQSGGWPLTIFLTADDLTPFFSGTYFPPETRYHLPAFRDVLQGIANLHRERLDDIKQQNVGLLHLLQHKTAVMSDIQFSDQPLKAAEQHLQQIFDTVNGGLQGAPKFPQPTILEFLLQSQSAMAENTLQHMAKGGIYDQLAGGFFRYSVDDHWEIPHFEKMLYDNGQLLTLYSYATTVYTQPLFAKIAQETAAWALNAMQASEGGFYSSLDADSEGHEGKFYVWDKEAVKTLLNADEFAVIELYFGLDQPPNFENHWHLRITQSLENVAAHLQINLSTAQIALQTAIEKLLAARNLRVSPNRDNKILTAWNALMVKGLFVAGDQLNDLALITTAQQTLKLIQQKFWVNQRLLATDHHAAYLDDYAFLIDALLISLQVSWNTEHLHFAVDLIELVLTHFTDTESGGFFFTADDHEKLLYRPKTMMDDVIPSGNGIITRALIMLGYLLGETRYLDAAEKTLQAAWPALLKYPFEHCSLLLALKSYLNPPSIVIIRGEENEIKRWRAACKNSQHLIFAIPHDAASLPEQLTAKKFTGKTCAYVCQGTQCLEVIEDLDRLQQRIS